MLDSWKEGTDSRENRDEDAKKNIRCNTERQREECGHQKGARSKYPTRESQRTESTFGMDTRREWKKITM